MLFFHSSPVGFQGNYTVIIMIKVIIIIIISRFEVWYSASGNHMFHIENVLFSSHVNADEIAFELYEILNSFIALLRRIALNYSRYSWHLLV